MAPTWYARWATLPTTLLRSVWLISRGFLSASSQRCASLASSSRSCFHWTAETRVLRQLADQSASSNGFSPALHRFINERPYRRLSTCAAIVDPCCVAAEPAVDANLSLER